MAERIRVGLVGYGMAGRVFHAPVISSVPALVLTTVVERRSAESRKRYPGVAVVDSAERLFADDDVDMVVVATPNASHYALAKAALVAGKHVVVDKPFTTTSAEADELIEIARSTGRVLSVFHNRRWDGDFLTLRRIVEGGLLGRVVELESRFDRFRSALRPGAWREAGGEGAGVLYDLAPHLVDQVLVLFGPPRAVTADVRAVRDGALADDTFEVVLHYDGLRAALSARMLAREPGPRFTAHGTLGSFVKRGLDPQEDALKGGGVPGEPGWGEEPRERWGTLDTLVGGLHLEASVETAAGRYQAFYENVAEAIAGRAPLAVTPEQAREVIRIVELARLSSSERRTVDFPS